MSRVIVWFSCGAASSVAAKLALDKYGLRVSLVYCDTGGEHPDNKRFLADVERWLETKVIILKNAQYENHFDVYRKTRWLVGPQGARCTYELKKKPREQFQKSDDIHILGFTEEERERARRFDVAFPELKTEWILIDRALRKQDCLGVLWQSGLKIPILYEMGYPHNNCLGCVKGGKGYWNKIRKDFSEVFKQMAQIERELDVSILRDRQGKRLFLDELSPTAGNFSTEPPISCGLGCWTTLKDFT